MARKSLYSVDLPETGLTYIGVEGHKRNEHSDEIALLGGIVVDTKNLIGDGGYYHNAREVWTRKESERSPKVTRLEVLSKVTHFLGEVETDSD